MKITRKFILALFIIISSGAFAQEAAKEVVSLNEQPLQLNTSISGSGESVGEICTDLSRALHRYYAQYKESLSVECARVRPEVKASQYSYTNWNGIFTWSWNYRLPRQISGSTITVDLFCVPRSLAEKQVLSVHRSCEKDPKPECFTEPYLSYLTKVQPTVFINNILETCGRN